MQKNPKDMDELLRLLMEFGYEVKQQKHIALRKRGQRFILLDSLADGYKTADLIAELASPSTNQPRPGLIRFNMLF